MFAAPDWPEAPLELPAGWSILLFTDGVIEGGVGGGPDRLGEDGLQRLIADYVGRRPGWRGDPHELLRELMASVEALNGEALGDDVAMLLVGSRDPQP